MSGLAWNWLCLPYLVCALGLIAVAVIAAVVRGDRVMRLGAIGAATNALPWALCSAAVTWTDDPEIATRLHRLGNGPVALVGPSLLLVLLGVSGQLERNRWIVRIAGLTGVVLSLLCWATDWTVAGVHRLSSGILYTSPGPLTGVHFSQIALWLALGIVIARRTTGGGERKRLIQLIVTVLALGTIGATDMLLVYDITGAYPVAWFPVMIAAGLAIYYELKSDLLRPQGLDHGVLVELVAFLVASIAIAVIAFVLSSALVASAVVASLAWAIALGVAWARTRDRPVRIASERALEELVASLGDLDTDASINKRLAELWDSIGIQTRAFERVEGGLLVTVGAAELHALPPTGGNMRPLDREIADWLVTHDDVLLSGDLGTALLGPIRPKLEALFAARRASMIVPLIDRGALVGLVEADHRKALREEERGLVVESSRAAARALTFVALARTAARELETAREVEVAEAMRLQASASRDDELGRWAVAAEYRTAARTTGAGWSASLLHDGRLAVLVTEAQAHGVAAALATAALTGAFAAATAPSKGSTAPLTLEDLLTLLRASVEGVVRGGEPVGAFIAILDGEARSITWASAGHPGAMIVGPPPEGGATASSSGLTASAMVLGGGGARLGASLEIATRGLSKLTPGSQLVIASTGLRADDDIMWMGQVRAAAPAGPRLASVLVEIALSRGEPYEDLLAVVVRQRPESRA